MIAVVTQNPDWRALEARLGECDEAEQRLRVDLRTAVAAHEAELAAWRQEADEARAQLRPAPEAPEPKDVGRLQDALRSVVARRQVLLQAQTALLGRLAPEVEAEWERARPDLVEKTQKAFGPLVEVLSEWRKWHQALLEARSARDNSGGRAINGPSARMRQRLDLHDLCDLLRFPEFDPTAPGPVPALTGQVQVQREDRKPEVVPVDRGNGRVGFNWG